MNAPDPVVVEGQVLLGKYRVERVLGQGGMGLVVAAHHIHLEERVAIKLMLAEAAFSPEGVARFVREARAAARLQSSHVAKVSDVGTLEDGRPYMVMEYLDGSDLSQLLRSSGVVALQDAVDYVLQAGEAIAEAHSIGIIHRDLKPGNLFLTRRRDRTLHVKVLDFGISKVQSAAKSSSDNAMTSTSAMMGSPLYMSPEQMTSVRDVDARSDIWALGIILFELLTGSTPFVGETLPQVCGLVIQSPDPSASSRRAGLPQQIDDIIHRCLAKNPDARYQNVAELAQALQGFAGRYGRASVERIMMLAGGAEPETVPDQPGLDPAASGVTNQAQGTHTAWGETRSTAPRHRSTGWLAAPLLGVPVLALAVWWFVGRSHADVAGPSASASVVTAAQSVSATLAPALAPVHPAPAATTAEPLPSAPDEDAAPPAPPSATRPASKAPAKPLVAGTPKPVASAQASVQAPAASVSQRSTTEPSPKPTNIVDMGRH